MIKNYFKIAWRTLLRYKAYTGINIVGLTLGIAAAILIFTLVSYQLSFDNFHPNKDRIFRIVTNIHADGNSPRYACVPQPLGKAFRNDFTFAQYTARMIYYRNVLISVPGAKDIKKFQEDNGIAFAEPGYFRIFHFPLVSGDSATALVNPHSALISESTAKKYFGGDPAVGRTIRVNNATNYTVTGVLKDPPPNTTQRHDIYLSYDNLKDWNSYLASDSSWGDLYSGSYCFVLLKPGVSPTLVDKSMPTLVRKYYHGDDAKVFNFALQPLADWHTDAAYDGSFDKKYSWALAVIGIFLLATACMNFINMATAQSLNRSKEVGIRKVMGSARRQLFWQFITETALITLVAGVLAWFIALTALPAINRLTGSQMTVHLLSGARMVLFCLFVFVCVVFAAGSYPGLILARFQPVQALKSRLSQAEIGGFSLRRVLVTSQFAISQVLIIGMIIVAWQMHYSVSLDLGFDKEAIVLLPIPSTDIPKMHTLRDRLRSIPGVQDLSLCYQPPASQRNMNTDIRYDNRPNTERWDINEKAVDDRYLSTFGLRLIAGRNLEPSDTTREFIVNETVVRQLGLSSPRDILGKMITVDAVPAPVVGVIRDFHNQSLHGKIDALCLYSSSGNYQTCSMKIDPRQLRAVLAGAESIWNDTYPEYVYSYSFLDERIAGFYRLDNILLALVEIFAAVAIVISCLGLYGLVSFMAVRRTKEIGIRKVLGAGIGNIFWLFGKEFSRLILIAFAIAGPLAWLATQAWLRDFTFRIHPGPLLFAAGLLATLLIALFAVGYRSMLAATANPVKSLRSE
ncbi:MAG TPA: ABC transporter permease [Puia sp.]|nr:ABC transporter permease [Puia sp.]